MRLLGSWTVRANYWPLLAAFMVALLAVWVGKASPAAESLLSLVSVGAVVAVHFRLAALAKAETKARKEAEDQGRPPPPVDLQAATDVQLQRRAILLCMVVGVLTAFQGLLDLKQLVLSDYVKPGLAWIAWGLFLVALGHPVYGLAAPHWSALRRGRVG